ncbi:MAG TPA: AbrB/MazE/SpoVT family DNA-binding domain-containing protein [Rhizomicrobium sp.]|jgi:AbrB family looped-hinge helix DNA binding protein
MNSTITAKGQTTIPKELRDKLGIKPGDKVRFFIDSRGGLAMLPVKPVTALRGMLKSDRTVSIEEMNEAILDEAAERDRRTR